MDEYDLTVIRAALRGNVALLALLLGVGYALVCIAMFVRVCLRVGKPRR